MTRTCPLEQGAGLSNHANTLLGRLEHLDVVLVAYVTSAQLHCTSNIANCRVDCVVAFLAALLHFRLLLLRGVVCDVCCGAKQDRMSPGERSLRRNADFLVSQQTLEGLGGVSVVDRSVCMSNNEAARQWKMASSDRL